MKTYITSMILAAAAIMPFVQGCKQEIPVYKGPDAACFTNQMGNDKTQFSFVANPGAEGVVRVGLTLIGRAAPHDRKVNVNVDPQGTTAKPAMYEILDATIPAGSFSGELLIKVFNTPEIEEDVAHLVLVIADSDDIAQGDLEHDRHTVSWSAQLLQPVTWYQMMRFFTQEYSSSAYRAIIESTGLAELYFYDREGNLIQDWAMNDALGKVAGKKFGDWIRNYNETHDTPYTHDDGRMQGRPVIPVL